MPPKVSLIERIKKDINLKKLSKVLEQLFQNTEIPNKEPRLNVGWAPAQTVTTAHGSNVPLTQFVVPYPEQWAVTRGASPYTFYTNIGTEPVGMMRNRRYWNKYKQTLRKPMVQVGEAVGNEKNNTRNQIMENAMSAGADGLILDGIVDNKAKNVRVILSQTPENVQHLSTSEAYLGAPLQLGPKRIYIGKNHNSELPFNSTITRVVRFQQDPRINKTVLGGIATLTAAEALDLYPNDPVIQHIYATQN